MKKFIKLIVIGLSLCVLILIGIKLWWVFQQEYLCKPKVMVAIEAFLNVAKASEYGGIHGSLIFLNGEHFSEFKRRITRTYEVKVRDWGAGGAAYTMVRFDNGSEYAFMVVPKKLSLMICWEIEYEVLTVR